MSEVLSKIPNGMRYYFGAEARRRRAIEETAMSIFAGWSYEEITTPTVDYHSLFEHGMGNVEARRAFRFTDVDGQLLALRPDVTSAAARAAATLLAEQARPLRLCYAASVFRQQPQSHAEWRRESTQIGCELIGENTPVADLELLAVAGEVFERLNLGGSYLITLNDVRFFNGVAADLGLDEDGRERMRRLIDARNAAELELFLASFAAKVEAAEFARLTQLSGKREILNAARQLRSNSESNAALDRLEALWNVIESLKWQDRFEIDLGDVARLDYYTGLTFKIYVRDAGTKVGSGGRYDGLTASFGRTEPAVGFVLDVDALTELPLLRQIDGSDQTDAARRPAGANVAELFRDAVAKRQQGERVILTLQR